MAAKHTTASAEDQKGFTAEEKAAMRERAKEVKAEARAGSIASKAAEAESALLAKIAEMPGPDRALAERIHALVKANAPGLSPKLWYGMPRTPGTARSPASSRPQRSSIRGTRRSDSTTTRTSTRGPCGRPHSR